MPIGPVESVCQLSCGDHDGVSQLLDAGALVGLYLAAEPVVQAAATDDDLEVFFGDGGGVIVLDGRDLGHLNHCGNLCRGLPFQRLHDASEVGVLGDAVLAVVAEQLFEGFGLGQGELDHLVDAACSDEAHGDHVAVVGGHDDRDVLLATVYAVQGVAQLEFTLLHLFLGALHDLVDILHENHCRLVLSRRLDRPLQLVGLGDVQERDLVLHRCVGQGLSHQGLARAVGPGEEESVRNVAVLGALLVVGDRGDHDVVDHVLHGFVEDHIVQGFVADGHVLRGGIPVHLAV